MTSVLQNSSTTFQTRYAALNKHQQSAVETIEGPVLCIAGPGTGKTEVIALRVGNILRTTQMRPSNILCLTFSVSGAVTMRERLRDLIGPDAYGVTISTIHGFCHDIISSHPQLFEEFAALEQISDTERYRALHQIIDDLMPDLMLCNPKDPHARSKDILDGFSLLKREGKSERTELREIAEEYATQMADKSREGTKAHEKNLRAAQSFSDFIELFERYQQMLQRTKRFDYDDMILTTIAALREEDWLLSQLQERYQYILVDEFQDLSGSQNTVIDLLTTQTGPDTDPNLFVVGDDDQAIYRFQGANIQHILRFTERFPNATIMPLSITYRCSAPIIAAASRLIEHNEERLSGKVEGFQKELVAAFQGETVEPKMLYVSSDQLEPWLVADLINERLDQGINPREIAVLTQTNAELFIIHDVLVARGIPVDLRGKVDLLTHDKVMQVIVILQALTAMGDSALLSSALSCSVFGLHPADLGALFALRRERQCSLLDLLPRIESLCKDGELHLRNEPTLLEIRDLLLDLAQKRETRTVIATLELVLRECGFLPEDPTNIDPIDYASLQAFFDHVKRRCYEVPHFGFDRFLADLAFYSSPDYADIRLTCSFPHLTLDGVQLMTAHQSKGLEFETVILYSVRDRHWNNRRRPPGLSMPKDLLFGWTTDQKKFEQNQDERRVMYVAMTRASKELILTCPRQMSSGDRTRDIAPSAFSAEAEIVEEEREVVDAEATSLLLHRPVREIDQEFASFLKNRIAQYSLSVTALNHFLEDPQLFLERDLLQVPQTKTLSLVYGNAVHKALRDWGHARMEGQSMDTSSFVGAFTRFLSEREVLTNADRANLARVGEQSLPRYYAQVLEGCTPTIFKVEHTIHTHLNDIPIKGALDRIDLAAPDSRSCSIIDYKTGSPKTESQIREGDYIRQLQFYWILIEESSLPLEPTAFILDFVGEGAHHPVQRAFNIADQEVADLKKCIADVWAKIVALDFTPL